MGIKMIAPVGNASNTVLGTSGAVYPVASDGSISNVASTDVVGLLTVGFSLFGTQTKSMNLDCPLPADLVSISAAAVATNRALTIAAQPPQARKLQVRLVIATAITAGILTVVGIDQDGNAVSETFSLAQATVTLKSKWAYSFITSATVTGLVGGGDGTLGIGVSNDFGLPTRQGGVDLAIIKATKTTKVLGTSNVVADDVASTAVVDTAARTVAPTTAPAANGLINYSFTYAYS